MPRLVLTSVTKRFGSLVALDDATLTIDDGEMVTVVGPSGSGKTTLLRTIAGLERIDAGSIVLGARDVTAASPRARNVALVFQDYALFPHLSVRANIGFGVRANRAGRVAEMASRLRIAELLDRRPGELSGGECQRVALARALAPQPEVLLFDEPFASLDAPLRAVLRREIAAFGATAALPSVFVTHDQDEALALGDRVAVLERGRIVALDTPRALLAAAPTAFVAGFLGRPPANVLAGDVRAGRFVLRGLPSVGCNVVGPNVSAVAVRPERLRIDPTSTVTGCVNFVETIGLARYATITVGTVSVVALVDDRTTRGDRVGVTFDFTECRAYDARGTYVA